MQITYKNNLKKVRTLIHSNITYGYVEPYNYPFNELKSCHEHTSYSLAPWSGVYSSNLNHVNLFDIMDQEQLDSYPYVLSRDGYLTLFDFFWRFPTPKGFSSIFLIYKPFAEFIPAAWLSKVLFFDYEFFDTPVPKVPTSEMLLVKGVLMENTFSMDQFKKMIDDAITKKKFKKLLICLSPRQNYFFETDWTGDRDFTNISNTVMEYLYRTVRPKIEFEFIDWKTYFSLPDMHQYYFIDINQKTNVYLDDQTDFFLMKKGAVPLRRSKKQISSQDDYLINLTHNHGIRIFDKVDEPKGKYFAEIERTLSILEIKKGIKLPLEGFRAVDDYVKAFKPVFEYRY
jgi:hypothetical protein